MYNYIGETHHLGERSHTHIYKYMEENPTGPKRNFSETLEQMKTAVSSNSTVSVLSCIIVATNAIIILTYYIDRFMDLKDHHGSVVFQTIILLKV